MRAALAVREGVAELNARPDLDLQPRIAVNTGEALVVARGAPELGEAMVAGDVVNTASRLQGAPVNGDRRRRGDLSPRPGRDRVRAARAGHRERQGGAVEVWLGARGASRRRATASSAAVRRARRASSDCCAGSGSACVDDRRPHLVTVFGPAGRREDAASASSSPRRRRAGGRVRARALAALPRQQRLRRVRRAAQAARRHLRERPVERRRSRSSSRGRGRCSATEADASPAISSLVLGLDAGERWPTARPSSSRCVGFVEAVPRERPIRARLRGPALGGPSLLDLVEMLARPRTTSRSSCSRSRGRSCSTRGRRGAAGCRPTPRCPSSRSARRRLVSSPAPARAGWDDGERGRRWSRRQRKGTRSSSSSSPRRSRASRSEPDALPTTVRGIVAARLDALPAAERAVLLDAAVEGKVFWRGALERVSRDPEQLPELLPALERRELIRRDRVSAIEDEHQYAFKHVLIRDVAYELLPRARPARAARAVRAVPRGVDGGGRRGRCGARAALA